MTDYLMLSPHAHVLGDSLCMLTAKGESRIGAPRALLTELARHANGTSPASVWLETLAERWSRQDLEPLIEHLLERGFLVSVESLPAALWRSAANPRSLGAPPDDEQVARLVAQARARTLAKGSASPNVTTARRDAIRITPQSTYLTTALSERRSERRFSRDVVTGPTIASLLWAGYGATAHDEKEREGHARIARTVPSAGALYPLDLYLCNFRPAEGIDDGVYHARFDLDQHVELEKLPADPASIVRAFGDPALIEHAQGIVIITGQFALSAAKYGVRALSYVALEAGHVAQNVLLQAQALDLAAVELGGFIEDTLANVAGLPADVIPLTTIAFGKPDSNGSEPRVATTGSVFEWLDFDSERYRLPFFMGQARMVGTTDWSWGRDRDPSRAWLKSIMEANERFACERPHATIDAHCSALADALPSSTLIAYSKQQYATQGFPFAPFDADARYQWVEGFDVATGRSVAIAADHIYYIDGLRPTRAASTAPLTAATSSGVAAHDTREAALESALLELIERDAFMRAWLELRPPPEIARESLPGDIQARLASLAAAGVLTWARTLDTAYGTGIFVAAQCHDRHFTRVASGCACDAYSALDHALMELEAAVAASFACEAAAPIQPKDVITSQDHARLYAQRRYFRRADWFIAADGATLGFNGLAQRRFGHTSASEAMLAAGRRVIAVDLNFPSDTAPRRPHIVRALMPGCVPLTFGYGLEPLGMVGGAAGRTPFPYFPHPYT